MPHSVPVDGVRVVVCTQDFDPTADLVIHHLTARGAPFWRVDPGAFPTELTLSAELSGAGWSGTLSGASRGARLEQLRAIYWRRPSRFRIEGLSEPERRFAERQARAGFGGVLMAMPNLTWVNHPARIADANKPTQLAIAASCGLATPRTLITSDPRGRVRDFARQVGGRIITKTLSTGNYTEAGAAGLLYTSEINERDYEHPGIAATAHLFQEVIEGTDVRLTAVGQECFAVAIRPVSVAGPLDIRAHHDEVTYVAIEPPSHVKAGVRAMMERMGLLYGTFDFKMGPDWTLLELNANGQFAHTEHAAGLAISAAIADLLIDGTERV
jgi:ATP-grasp ribosomal peptide maturase